jgi:Nup85 Nucleoporin
MCGSYVRLMHHHYLCCTSFDSHRCLVVHLSGKRAHATCCFFQLKLLETEDPDTESKALQLLSVCEQHQLTNQMSTVQRVMGAKKFAQHRPVSSVYWLMLAQDVTRLSQVADRLIDQCVAEKTTVEDLDGVAEHLGDQKFVFSEKLSFLNKYCELQRFRQVRSRHVFVVC